MSEYALHTVFLNPEQAKKAISGQIAPYCKNLWAQGIDQLAVTIQPLEDQRSIQQNRYYWGFLLKHVSEQAKVNGIGATPEGWHLYFKKELLGYEFTKVREPGKTRKTVRKELRSTTGLSVKKMAEYMQKVEAMAATEFGVQFPSDINWENYRG